MNRAHSGMMMIMIMMICACRVLFSVFVVMVGKLMVFFRNGLPALLFKETNQNDRYQEYCYRC